MTTTNYLSLPPSSIPSHIPSPPTSTDIPEYPELGLAHPAALDAWKQAHLKLAKARYMLEPKVLRAYSEARLEVEKWDAQQRGRKPSGDLRHPVPRNRLTAIAKEMSGEHERTISSANQTINAISTGEVVDVKPHKVLGPNYPVLVLQSDLDRETPWENLTDDQRELDEAKWEQLVAELLAEITPEAPEPAPPYLPDLPRDRDPTDAEVRELVVAMKVHTDYVERHREIEAKRQADALTKVRTQRRLEAEKADPEGTAAAKKEIARQKAADRQRRFRERQKKNSIKT